MIPSLILGLLLGWDTCRETLATLDWQVTREAVPLATMALAVGIFEATYGFFLTPGFIVVLIVTAMGAHAVMHVAAVLHGAESTVQLPPHLATVVDDGQHGSLAEKSGQTPQGGRSRSPVDP